MRPVLVMIACCWALPVIAGGDGLCESAKFREAFEKGRRVIDFPRHSGELLAFGPAAVPCLIEVADRGGAALGIKSCSSDEDGCRVWAIGAITRLDSSAGREFLVAALDRKWPERVMTSVLGAVGMLRLAGARPRVLSLLNNDSPGTRSQAVLALGMLGHPDDIDRMLTVVKALPEGNLGPAVRGIEFTADARAIPVLEDLVLRVADPAVRAEIGETLARLKSGTPIRPKPISASGR